MQTSPNERSADPAPDARAPFGAASLQHAPLALATITRDGRIRHANDAWGALLDRPAPTLADEALARVMPKVWERVAPVAEWVATHGIAVTDLEVRLQPQATSRHGPAGERHWHLDVFPVDRGDLDGDIGLLAVDTTERDRAEREIRVLAGASELFAQLGAREELLDRAARLAVPDFADASILYLTGEDGRSRRAVVTHRDPETEARLAALVARASEPGADGALARVLRTGVPALRAGVTAPDWARSAADPDHHAFLVELAACSAVTAPLAIGDRRIGALTLCYTSASGRWHQQRDVTLAQELGRRVAQLLENLRLTEEAARVAARDRDVVEILQRSLLPAALPDVPGVRIAGSYLPASEGLPIGGDWYDAVSLPDGRLFLAIGDVVGHGVRAASAMGRLRTALHMWACEGLQPAAALARVNRHFGAARDGDMATLCALVLDPATGELCIASAGHPPPAVREPDGSVRFVTARGGPPVGALPHAVYRQDAMQLEPGTMLVLYTDGLVERRGEPIDDGLARLEAALASAPSHVDDVAVHLLAQRPADAVDDVAVLVVQLAARGAPLALVVPAEPRALASLRQSFEQWLRAVGVAPGFRQEMVLALNEAAANAVEHAYRPGDGRVHVEADLREGVLHVLVRDWGRWRPARAVGGGRGLSLMDTLTDELTVTTTELGTDVVMRRALTRPGAEPRT